MLFATSKSMQTATILNMGVSKINGHVEIKINIPNPSQKPDPVEIWIWMFFVASKSV